MVFLFALKKLLPIDHSGYTEMFEPLYPCKLTAVRVSGFAMHCINNVQMFLEVLAIVSK
jgi:hypothetical protein